MIPEYDPDAWKREARLRHTMPDRTFRDITHRLTEHAWYGGNNFPEQMQTLATQSPKGASFNLGQISYYPEGLQLFLLAQELQNLGHDELVGQIEPRVALRFEPSQDGGATFIYAPDEGPYGLRHKGVLKVSGPVEMWKLGEKPFTIDDITSILPRMMIVQGTNNDEKNPVIYTFDETFSAWSLHTKVQRTP